MLVAQEASITLDQVFGSLLGDISGQAAPLLGTGT
jgi:hypothetical protein